jgi:hypothetical protein
MKIDKNDIDTLKLIFGNIHISKLTGIIETITEIFESNFKDEQSIKLTSELKRAVQRMNDIENLPKNQS